jgi:hypothetical protein
MQIIHLLSLDVLKRVELVCGLERRLVPGVVIAGRARRFLAMLLMFSALGVARSRRVTLVCGLRTRTPLLLGKTLTADSA